MLDKNRRKERKKKKIAQHREGVLKINWPDFKEQVRHTRRALNTEQ